MDPLSRINPNFLKAPPVDFAALMALMAKGHVMMGWADPFFPDPCLPAHVIDATKQSLDASGGHYTAPVGSLELRQEIARKLKRFNDLDVDPVREIIIKLGSDTGLWHAMQVVIAPGDEVLNFEPSYPSNFRNTALMGGRNIVVPLRKDADFTIDFDALERAVTSATKAIILTQPNNPTTTVHDRQALLSLSKFVVRHDLLVVADHAFEETVEPGRELVTIASLPGMWERTISVFSTSKGMGMSGFRIGYNVACAPIMAVMHNSAVSVLGAANTAAQHGAIAAFRDSAYVRDFLKIYEQRRIFAHKVLNAVPGVACGMPQSGFMIWPDISRLGTSKDIFEHLISDANIIVSRGDNFGPSGEGYIRIMLSALRDQDAFEEAMRRIAESLRKLPLRGDA